MPQSPPQEINEQVLVTLFRQGQPQSLALLYDKYAPVLLGLAYRIMRQEEAAEAVLQETFVAVWRRRNEYDASRLSLLSWLILITRDTAKTALEKGNLNSARPGDTASEKLIIKNDTSKNGQVAQKIKEIFCNLAPQEKAALDLVYMQGYTCTEAAAALNITEENLKTLLKKAGQHLREGKG